MLVRSELFRPTNSFPPHEKRGSSRFQPRKPAILFPYMTAEIVFTLPLNLTDNHLANKSSHIKVLEMALNIETITDTGSHSSGKPGGKEAGSARKQSPTSQGCHLMPSRDCASSSGEEPPSGISLNSTGFSTARTGGNGNRSLPPLAATVTEKREGSSWSSDFTAPQRAVPAFPRTGSRPMVRLRLASHCPGSNGISLREPLFIVFKPQFIKSATSPIFVEDSVRAPMGKERIHSLPALG